MENLFTFQQFLDEQKIFSNGALRNIIFKRHENGLEQSGAIKRYGRKILIDKILFFKWLDSIQNKNHIHKPNE